MTQIYRKNTLVDIGVEHFPNFIKLKLADAMAHQITKDTKWAIDTISKLYERFNKDNCHITLI